MPASVHRWRSWARATAWKVPATGLARAGRARRADGSSSLAALRVKVMTRTWPGSAVPVARRYATRRVSTRVLPAPGPATMQSGAPALVTAARCSASRSSSSRPRGRVVGHGGHLREGVVHCRRPSFTIPKGLWKTPREGKRHVGREPGQNAVRPRVAFRPKPSVLLGAAPRSTSRRFLRTLQRSGASGVPWPPCVPTCVDPPGGGRRLRRDSSRTPAAPPRPKAPSPLAGSRFPRAGRSRGSAACCSPPGFTPAACGALRIRWRHFADSQHNRQESFDNFRHLWITCGHSCGDIVDGMWVTAVTLWTARQ